MNHYEKMKKRQARTREALLKERQREEFNRLNLKLKTDKKVDIPKDITYEYDWERNLRPRQRSNLKRVKQSWFFKDFIARGFTPFTKEWRAESLRVGKIEYRKSMNEAQRKRRNEKRLANRRKNIEESRRKDREKRKRKVEQLGRDEVNRLARARYARQRSHEAAKQRARRHERDPSRAIRANTQLYLKGFLTDEQYVKSVDECIERTKQAEHQGLGRRERRIKKERDSR